MTVILPEAPGGSASGWRLTDYKTHRARTDPATGGLATVELAQLASDELWLIDHGVVACDSTTETEARWYETSVSDLQLIDGTGGGNFDVADWPAGLHVEPGSSLVVQWTGASDGARGIVTIQYRVLRR